MTDENDDEEDEVNTNRVQMTNHSPVICNICGRTFSEKVDLSLHVRSAHFGMNETTENSSEVIVVDDGMENKLSYDSDEELDIESDCVCKICFSIFKDSADMKAHTILAHSCTTETAPTKTENGTDHENSIDSDTLNASGNVISNSNQKVPSEEAELDTSFHNSDNSEGHTTVQSDEKTCTSLNNKPVLQEDPSVDSISNRGSSSDPLPDGILEIGKRKETPLPIDDHVIIEDDITDQSNLQSIEKKHPRVVCNICVQEFDTKEMLTVHIKSAHFGISSYKCAMCSLTFESRDQVIKHYNNCDGEGKVNKTVEDPPIGAEQKVSKNELVKMKQKVRKKKLSKKKYTKKKHEKKRISDRIANKQMNELSKPRRSPPPRSQSKSRKKNKNVKEKDNQTSELDSTENLEVSVDGVPKPFVRKRRRGRPPAPLSVVTDMNDQAIVYETVRPCYICGQRFFSSNNELNHMMEKHSEYLKPSNSQLSLLELKPMEKFKCLRCGKVGVLSVIQSHLQEKCLRSPFQGVKALDEFYCTVCGQHFHDAQSHDIHVASVHYSHLYDPDSKHFPSIPFPHILLYHISPKVCQHCGKNCQFTMKSTNAAENASIQEVSCIEGPYICPYGHAKTQSRCTLDLLLHHLKFCAYRSGVLALQCNNCFKMLLCNNAPEQVDQLREIVEMKYLACCSIVEKTFKCYCCTQDFQWSTITRQLKFSIKRLDYARLNSTNSSSQAILNRNPSIHTKGPQLLAKRMDGLNKRISVSLGGADVSHSQDKENNNRLKRRKTSFDVIESNLAKMQQSQKLQKSLSEATEESYKPTNKSDKKSTSFSVGKEKLAKTQQGQKQQKSLGNKIKPAEQYARLCMICFKNPNQSSSYIFHSERKYVNHMTKVHKSLSTTTKESTEYINKNDQKSISSDVKEGNFAETPQSQKQPKIISNKLDEIKRRCLEHIQSLNKTDDQKSSELGNFSSKTAPLGPIKITNTYKPPDQPEIAPVMDEISPTLSVSSEYFSKVNVQNNSQNQRSQPKTENRIKSLELSNQQGVRDGIGQTSGESSKHFSKVSVQNNSQCQRSPPQTENRLKSLKRLWSIDVNRMLKKQVTLEEAELNSQPYIIEEITHDTEPSIDFVKLDDYEMLNESDGRRLPAHAEEKGEHSHTGGNLIEAQSSQEIFEFSDHVERYAKQCLICNDDPYQYHRKQSNPIFYSEAHFLDHMTTVHKGVVQKFKDGKSKFLPCRLVKLRGAKNPLDVKVIRRSQPHIIEEEEHELHFDKKPKVDSCKEAKVYPQISGTKELPARNRSGDQSKVQVDLKKELVCTNNLVSGTLRELPQEATTVPKLSVCRVCSSRNPSKQSVFYDERSLVLHMIEHGEENSDCQVFTCYDCATLQLFSTQQQWRNHIKSRHPFCVILQCDYKNCFREFQRPQDLQDHILSEHNYTFGCAVCFVAYRSEEELVEHSNVMHGTA